MQVSVTGKQIDVGDALRGHIASALESAVGKYFDQAIDGSVVMTPHAHLLRADISVHIGRGILLQSHAEAGDAYSAFDSACGKIEKRLRRYKRWLRDHRKGKSEQREVLVANQYILAGPGADEAGDAGEPDDNPVIVAEMATEIGTMTVGEAVLRMDLADLPAMMFRNSAHGGLNVVYRRPDGNVGWIDPQGNRQGRS